MVASGYLAGGHGYNFLCKMLSENEALKIIEDIIDPAEIIEYAGINKLKSILKNEKKED